MKFPLGPASSTGVAESIATCSGSYSQKVMLCKPQPFSTGTNVLITEGSTCRQVHHIDSVMPKDQNQTPQHTSMHQLFNVISKSLDVFC